MPESVFTQTIPALLAGGACVRAAGFEAGVDAVEGVLLPETGVAAGAGLLVGAVEAAGVTAGVDAAVATGWAEADFFERLFFGAAALLSAGAAVLAVELSAAAVFFDSLLGLPSSEDDAEREESAASLLSAEADFFERPFLGADAVELAATAVSSADALFLDLVFFLVVEAVELSAVAFSSAAADFLVVLFFFEDAVPVSADACEDEASEETVPAFFFFWVCFLAESVCL